MVVPQNYHLLDLYPFLWQRYTLSYWKSWIFYICIIAKMVCLEFLMPCVYLKTLYLWIKTILSFWPLKTFPSFGAVRWKIMGWLQSVRWSRKCFCRTEYNYCHKDCIRSLPRTVGILLLEVNNKTSSPIWHLCQYVSNMTLLYKWNDTHTHTHFYR